MPRLRRRPAEEDDPEKRYWDKVEGADYRPSCKRWDAMVKRLAQQGQRIDFAKGAIIQRFKLVE